MDFGDGVTETLPLAQEHDYLYEVGDYIVHLQVKDGAIAVSYTHLDVYKRQLLDCRACKARHRADKLIGEEHPEVNVDAMAGSHPGPVSYTHLDVYKRQALSFIMVKY